MSATKRANGTAAALTRDCPRCLHHLTGRRARRFEALEADGLPEGAAGFCVRDSAWRVLYRRALQHRCSWIYTDAAGTWLSDNQDRARAYVLPELPGWWEPDEPVLPKEKDEEEADPG